MSPNRAFPSDSTPLNPIAARVLRDPNLTYDVGDNGVVIAVTGELLVRRSARLASSALNEALATVADNCGSLDQASGRDERTGPGSLHDLALADLEVWRIREAPLDRGVNSIDEARRLRRLTGEVTEPGQPALPAVTPHHVAILSPAMGGCPAAPPEPAGSPDAAFVRALQSDSPTRVTVLDSGYITIAPPHVNLDARVTLLDGQHLDTSTIPPTWRPDRPDGLYTDPEGRLDGIAGHGTFIAGLIAHACPEAKLTVVGLRDQEVEVGTLDPAEQTGLYSTEVAITRALLAHADADIVQCGFAFPTLDDYPSLPFAAAMEVLRGASAPRPGVVVVAPAGNETSAHPHWPAALGDVIGVAATNRHGHARADFSNWGRWLDCCTRGEDVYSTFIRWNGPIEGEAVSDVKHFGGWARWDGTSFAAPQVSAAIGRVLTGDPSLLPTEAWQQLITGASGVRITPLTDFALTSFPGVTLPNLHLE